MAPSAQEDGDADGIASRLRKRRRESAAIEDSPNKRARKASKVQNPPKPNATQKTERTMPAPASTDNVVNANDTTLEASQPTISTSPQAGPRPSRRSQDGEPTAQEPLHDEADERQLGRDITRAIRQLVDLQYAPKPNGTPTSILANPGGYGAANPEMDLRMQSLPILENIAVQILSTFAKSSFEDIVGLMKFPNSEKGPAFATLKSLFNLTLKIYNKERPFLSVAELPLPAEDVHDVLRKANLATWMLAILGSQDASFFHLNEYFVDTFVPFGHHLQDWQGTIFVDLKTQAYINAMLLNLNLPKEDILTDLFPPDLERRLLLRRTDSTQLAPSEQYFITNAYARRDLLRAQPVTQEGISALMNRFDWIEFLQGVTAIANERFDGIIAEAARSPSIVKDWLIGQAHGVTEQGRDAEISALQGRDVGAYTTSAPSREDAQLHLPMYSDAHGSPNPNQFYPAVDREQNPSPNPQPDLDDASVPSGPQAEPTRVLYQRARLAATAKTTPTSRRAGGASQRRAWSAEEEAALMAGLDRVRGPHWSQILAMFGAGGTVSEVLKDRNQVQLKDKARNLKLFFLKSGNEVPPYLQAVTGELKTRAPAQVRKEEANERLRDSVDVDKATVDAINLLAAGSRQALEAQHGAGAAGTQDDEDDDDDEMPDQSPDDIQAALARAMEAMNQPPMDNQQYFDRNYQAQLAAAASEQYDPFIAARDAEFLNQRAAIQAHEDALRQGTAMYPTTQQHQQPNAHMMRDGGT